MAAFANSLARMVTDATRAFGETVTYTPHGGEPVNVEAIVSSGEGPVGGAYHIVSLRAADLPVEVDRRDKIIVRGETCGIYDPTSHDDGTVDLIVRRL